MSRGVQSLARYAGQRNTRSAEGMPVNDRAGELGLVVDGLSAPQCRAFRAERTSLGGDYEKQGQSHPGQSGNTAGQVKGGLDRDENHPDPLGCRANFPTGRRYFDVVRGHNSWTGYRLASRPRSDLPSAVAKPG